MAFIPPKSLREQVIKGDYNNSEKLDNSNSYQGYSKSSTLNDINPASGIIWGALVGNLWN